jgi:hypothetical protein
VVLEPERDVVTAAGEHGLGDRVLEQEPRARRPGLDAVAAGGARGDAVQEEIALLLAGAVLAGLEQAGEAREQGRLPRAARPEKEDALAGRDDEVDVPQRPRPPRRVPPSPPPGRDRHGRRRRHTRRPVRPEASGPSAPVAASARVSAHPPSPAITAQESTEKTT